MGGFLDRDNIVHLVLTVQGRRILSKNPEKFKITKIAFGDSEIDYSLYGNYGAVNSDELGKWIEKTPILEPPTNEVIALRSKLISAPPNMSTVPYINISPDSVSLYPKEEVIISSITYNATAGNNDSGLGYQATLLDTRIASISSYGGQINSGEQTMYAAATNVNIPLAETVVSKSGKFKITAKALGDLIGVMGYDAQLSTSIQVVGKESGASKVFQLTVRTTSNPNASVVNA